MPRRSRRVATRLTSALALTLCGGAALIPAGVSARQDRAHASRTLTLNETGHLKLISRHGLTLVERGSATGTYAASVEVHLTLVSSTRATAQITVSRSGGSITGSGSAAYHNGHSQATFSGAISISHGTGSYSHAHGSGMHISGTLNRSNDAITVHLSGSVSD
jgi:hypothetical protein